VLSHKGFYGYINSAFAGVALLLLGGANYLLPALAGFMKKDLGWSAAAYGGAFSVYYVVFGIVVTVAGMLVVRFGPRLLIVVGAGVLVVVCALLSLVNELWQFYLLAGVYGAAVSGGGVVTGPQLTSNWLHKRRGMVIGLLLAGTALGGSLLTVVGERVMAAYDSWRPSWLVIAALMTIAVAVTVLFVRTRPEDRGQMIDGVTDLAELERAEGRKTARVYKCLDPWTAGQAVRTPSLWLLVLVYGLCNYTYLGTLPHQVSFLTGERGVSSDVAAGALALMVGFMAVGKAGGGWLADRIEPKKTLGLTSLTSAAGLALLLFWHGVPALYLYVSFLGIGFGGCQSQTSAALANYFGRQHVAAILGLTMGPAALLGALSTWLTGYISDQAASYVPAFVVMLVLSVIGGICAFVTPVPRYRGASS
jgi:MFS family permease